MYFVHDIGVAGTKLGANEEHDEDGDDTAADGGGGDGGQLDIRFYTSIVRSCFKTDDADYVKLMICAIEESEGKGELAGASVFKTTFMIL